MTASLLNKLNTFYKSFLKNKIQLSSDIVGARIKPYHYQVSFRHVSNYAASIFEKNSVYYNTNKEKEIVAHPLFPVRISWQIVKNINQLWEIDFPDNALDNLVHQSEYLEIHRLLKPGDDLTIHGELAALVPHKLGAKITLKFDFYDKENKLVLTEYIGAILFGVKCSDNGRSLVEPPVIERIENSSAIWEEQISISRLAPYIYDGCNDIVYPIHTDTKFAKKMGLPDIILQGTATLAMSVSAVIKKELNNDPRLVKVISGKFTDIVVPPNQLCIRLLKKTSQELFFDVMDNSGKFVLKGGYVKY